MAAEDSGAATDLKFFFTKFSVARPWSSGKMRPCHLEACLETKRSRLGFESRRAHVEQISFEEWKKLKLVVGKVLDVQRIPKTGKLYKLRVDIGAENPIQIITSLVPYYTEKELKNQKIIVLVNLKPTKFAGEVSEGMLLCAEKEDGSKCILLTTEKDVDVGTRIT